MSKPAFKTFIVILIVTAIASTSGQRDGGSTQLSTQGAAPGTSGSGNSGTNRGSGGTGVRENSDSSGSDSTSGTDGSGLIDGVISIPATLLRVILLPIRALLSIILGNVGNLVGTILNLVLNLLRISLTPLSFVVGFPLDIVADTLIGLGGAVGSLLHGILSLILSDLGGSGNVSQDLLAIAGPAAASTRVRRDLVMEAIMGRGH